MPKSFRIGDKVMVIRDVETNEQTHGEWIGIQGVVTHVYDHCRYKYQLDNRLVGPFAAEELQFAMIC